MVSTQFDERMEALGRPFDGILEGIASLSLHGSELNKTRREYLDMAREKFGRISFPDYLNGPIKPDTLVSEGLRSLGVTPLFADIGAPEVTSNILKKVIETDEGTVCHNEPPKPAPIVTATASTNTTGDMEDNTTKIELANTKTELVTTRSELDKILLQLTDLKTRQEKTILEYNSLIEEKQSLIEGQQRLREDNERMGEVTERLVQEKERMRESLAAAEVDQHDLEKRGEQNERLKNELEELKIELEKQGQVLEESSKLKAALNTLTSDSRRTEQELRKELLKLQESYKRELDKIRSENEQLRKVIKETSAKTTAVKKSIIDMYADVLDTLSTNDSSYNFHDHLPRVVVVGDQSAGKTSVLEMIVRARIFPRGHGEMMTRSPVQVTLGEADKHFAQFNDRPTQYDLTSETELSALRSEVERRMKANIKAGETISTEPISLTVKGPGLHRMVLVDLPGIISTETSGMSVGTKESLSDMCQSYMKNPNAIILCIQDGSIDAERSIVTSLVQSHDPKGKRTIFVLTKVDLAESNMANPTRVKKILEGKLFPMKALGYYAVVTGRGPTEDSVESIRAYEEDFFSRSKLFRSGAMRASQMSTNNLSLAVSDVFWKMVGDSVEQQADYFKAARYNLEAEWRNTFAGLREMDRNDLFEKAKDDILDDISALHKLTPIQWEELLQANLWDKIAHTVVDGIYLNAAQCTNPSNFNTKVDISLKDWTDEELPNISVEVGWQTLFKQLQHIMSQDKSEETDDLFQPMKQAILEAVNKQHKWQNNAKKRLSVIQKNALEDTAVTDKMQWDNSITFMEQILNTRINDAKDALDEVIGPSWTERWAGWRARSPLETQCVAAKNELQKLLVAEESHSQNLENDELTTVRKNLQTQGVDVPYEIICQVWQKLYHIHFLQRALSSAQQCRKAFYHRSIACNAVECNDVVLFWRANKMLDITSNALRLQIMNTEAQRLEKEVKQYLEDISQDEDKKRELINGKRVDLAEQLRNVRGIQDRLEAFIDELKKEHI